MSDEFPHEDRAWRRSAEGPRQDDPEVLTVLAGRIDRIHPIGPMSLRARTRRPYILVAVAVAALLGGAGAALVVTDSGTPLPAHNASAAGPAPSSSPVLPGTVGPGSRSSAPGHAVAPGVLHGQYVVRRPGGGYQTVDVQNGQVTAVSSTSITLRSADGFTYGYVISRSTAVAAGHGGIASVRVGDQASVQATVTGSSAVATSITDLTVVDHRGSATDRLRGACSALGGDAV
jgi:hypothetical protein